MQGVKLVLILSNMLKNTPVWVVREFRAVWSLFQALKQSNPGKGRSQDLLEVANIYG